mmetsp:Transcript_9450/g.15506  ORF Transcript_9450/g.15506 Transcript_9450/m.15506 type:complete len:180 (+) Transcript_9450:24-563(+)
MSISGREEEHTTRRQWGSLQQHTSSSPPADSTITTSTIPRHQALSSNGTRPSYKKPTMKLYVNVAAIAVTTMAAVVAPIVLAIEDDEPEPSLVTNNRKYLKEVKMDQPDYLAEMMKLELEQKDEEEPEVPDVEKSRRLDVHENVDTLDDDDNMEVPEVKKDRHLTEEQVDELEALSEKD